MSDDQQPLKVKFAPGVLEQLEKDMEPGELQEFLDVIKKGFEDGSFFEQSTPVDMDELRENEPELYKKLSELDDSDPDESPTLH